MQPQDRSTPFTSSGPTVIGWICLTVGQCEHGGTDIASRTAWFLSSPLLTTRRACSLPSLGKSMRMRPNLALAVVPELDATRSSSGDLPRPPLSPPMVSPSPATGGGLLLGWVQLPRLCGHHEMSSSGPLRPTTTRLAPRSATSRATTWADERLSVSTNREGWGWEVGRRVRTAAPHLHCMDGLRPWTCSPASSSSSRSSAPTSHLVGGGERSCTACTNGF
jgi:hypothetical protein